MKNPNVFLFICLVVVVVFGFVVVPAMQADERSQLNKKEEYMFISKTITTSAADQTAVFDFAMSGVVNYIIIDSAGTDTAFNVDLIVTVDAVDYTMATFTCSSTHEPYKLAVTSVSAAGVAIVGIPVVNDKVKVRVYNVDGLTACKVVLFGKFPKRYY